MDEISYLLFFEKKLYFLIIIWFDIFARDIEHPILSCQSTRVIVFHNTLIANNILIIIYSINN